MQDNDNFQWFSLSEGQDHVPQTDSWVSSFEPNLNSGNAVVPPSQTNICELSLSLRNVTVVGKVVFVDALRSFSKHGQDRYLLKYMIKDNTGTIICVSWLDSAIVHEVETVKLGERIQLINPDVKPKKAPENGVNYRSVESTSPFELHLSSRQQALVELYQGRDLFSIPLVDRGFVSLKSLTKEMNPCPPLLVCVRQVGPVQTFAKGQKTTSKRDVVVMDSSMPAIILTVWGATCESANTWSPFQTILLLKDTSVTSFRDQLQLSIGFLTLVDVDPLFPLAQQLYNSVQKQKERLGHRNALAELSSTRTETALASLKSASSMKLREAFRLFEQSDKTQPLVFGASCVLTKLDLDTFDDTKLFSTFCNQCKQRWNGYRSCPCGQSPEPQLNIKCTFADETGSVNTTLFHQCALSLLQLTSADIPSFSANKEMRGDLQSTLMLERSTVYFKIHHQGTGPRIDVLALDYH